VQYDRLKTVFCLSSQHSSICKAYVAICLAGDNLQRASSFQRDVIVDTAGKLGVSSVNQVRTRDYAHIITLN